MIMKKSSSVGVWFSDSRPNTTNYNQKGDGLWNGCQKTLRQIGRWELERQRKWWRWWQTTEVIPVILMVNVFYEQSLTQPEVWRLQTRADPSRKCCLSVQTWSQIYTGNSFRQSSPFISRDAEPYHTQPSLCLWLRSCNLCRWKFQRLFSVSANVGSELFVFISKIFVERIEVGYYNTVFSCYLSIAYSYRLFFGPILKCSAWISICCIYKPSSCCCGRWQWTSLRHTYPRQQCWIRASWRVHSLFGSTF